MNTTKLDRFTEAYIEGALWAEMDNSTPQGGEPLRDNYSIEDLEPDTLKKMTEDCQKFQRENETDLSEATNPTGKFKFTGGHDFWLTRNNHGAGSWDGDWSEPQATRLTEASKAFGEYNLVITDDGKIQGQIKCRFCGSLFDPKDKNQVFCNETCTMAYRIQTDPIT